MTGDLTAGFADPVADAQRCFRALLDAMARPGQVHRLTGVTPPAPMSPAAAAALLCLADHETSLFVPADLRAVRDWVAFHAGAPFAAQPDDASFVYTSVLPPLSTLRPGTHEVPESSATLVLDVAALGSGRTWHLSGPGLREIATLRVAGLPDDFAALWASNRRLFPCGIDLILCAKDQIAALPRTVSVEEG